MFNYPGNAHFLAMSMRDARALDSEELAVLATELQKEKYVGKTPKECLAILHDPTGDTNTTSRLADWPTTRKFLAGYQYRLLTGDIQVPADIAQKWLLKIPVILAGYEDDFKFTPGTSTLFNQIATESIADGVATPQEVGAFLAQFEQTYLLSPAEKLFGKEFFIELSDIVGALG